MVLALNMTWTHCEVSWDLNFEPSETSGGQPVALGSSVFGLYFWDSIDPLDDAALFNLVAFDTDAVNIASLSENIGGPPETNSSSLCLLTYHALCRIVRLLQHTVGLRPLPPPRLLCPTFPLSVYTSAVNPP